ncbi:hypothetical protein BDW22DRAFT_844951 [Trametopsis cervina]|nr:hypothetical protein BDW22DRAFT_844951 [Trametopsis cervina]
MAHSGSERRAEQTLRILDDPRLGSCSTRRVCSAPFTSISSLRLFGCGSLVRWRVESSRRCGIRGAYVLVYVYSTTRVHPCYDDALISLRSARVWDIVRLAIPSPKHPWYSTSGKESSSYLLTSLGTQPSHRTVVRLS